MARIRSSCSSTTEKDKNKTRNEAKEIKHETKQEYQIFDKKDIMNETADIGGFTLMFRDPDKELKWLLTHRKRHIGISQRYFFACAIFQGLFFWSDVLEGRGTRVFSVRITLGIFSLAGGLLISAGVLSPHQSTLLISSIIYGFPSLFIYYGDRTNASHWDSLFLVYGLCFLMLPKISPLNFIWGFSGSALFSLLFIILSAFRLRMQEWILSSILLLIIVILFMYISYSSEKSSRERWLLRDRLNREHINLQMVASSIQEDLKRAARERQPFRLNVFEDTRSSLADYRKIYPPNILSAITPTSISATSLHLHSSIVQTGDVNTDGIVSSDLGDEGHALVGSSNNVPIEVSMVKNQRQIILFFKGLIAWAICMGTGYAFDLVSLPVTAAKSEANSSAAFALMMHCTGFSIFLLYFTGQIRWLALNGVVGFSLLWIFNQTGMDNKWVVFSTHSVGYMVLVAVIIIMILVLGGVVLVWTNLVDFLKDVLIRYPQVKDELAQKKVLEQVILRCLSDLPKQEILFAPDVEAAAAAAELSDDDESKMKNAESSSNTVEGGDNVSSNLEVARGRVSQGMLEGSTILSSPHRKKVDSMCTQGGIDRSVTQLTQSTVCHSVSTKVLQSKRPGCCYFCLRDSPIYLLPACTGWGPRVTTGDDNIVPQGIAMCTPYTELCKTRDLLSNQVKTGQVHVAALEGQCLSLQAQVDESTKVCISLQQKIDEINRDQLVFTRQHEDTLKREREQREKDVQFIISQHNAQLTELKRLYRSLRTSTGTTGNNRAVMTGRSADRHDVTVRETDIEIAVESGNKGNRKSAVDESARLEKAVKVGTNTGQSGDVASKSIAGSVQHGRGAVGATPTLPPSVKLEKTPLVESDTFRKRDDKGKGSAPLSRESDSAIPFLDPNLVLGQGDSYSQPPVLTQSSSKQCPLELSAEIDKVSKSNEVVAQATNLLPHSPPVRMVVVNDGLDPEATSDISFDRLWSESLDQIDNLLHLRFAYFPNADSSCDKDEDKGLGGSPAVDEDSDVKSHGLTDSQFVRLSTPSRMKYTLSMRGDV